jgi:hypothetical protein
LKIQKQFLSGPCTLIPALKHEYQPTILNTNV